MSTRDRATAPARDGPPARPERHGGERRQERDRGHDEAGAPALHAVPAPVARRHGQLRGEGEGGPEPGPCGRRREPRPSRPDDGPGEEEQERGPEEDEAPVGPDQEAPEAVEPGVGEPVVRVAAEETPEAGHLEPGPQGERNRRPRRRPREGAPAPAPVVGDRAGGEGRTAPPRSGCSWRARHTRRRTRRRSRAGGAGPAPRRPPARPRARAPGPPPAPAPRTRGARTSRAARRPRRGRTAAATSGRAAAQPAGERSRGRRREADGEPGDEEEERLGAPRAPRRLDPGREPGRGHLEEARRHPEPRDGVAAGAVEGEVATRGLADPARLDERDGGADHLAAVGDQADVPVVADESQEQEAPEHGAGQGPVDPSPGRGRRPGGTVRRRAALLALAGPRHQRARSFWSASRAASCWAAFFEWPSPQVTVPSSSRHSMRKRRRWLGPSSPTTP